MTLYQPVFQLPGQGYRSGILTGFIQQYGKRARLNICAQAFAFVTLPGLLVHIPGVFCIGQFHDLKPGIPVDPADIFLQSIPYPGGLGFTDTYQADRHYGNEIGKNGLIFGKLATLNAFRTMNRLWITLIFLFLTGSVMAQSSADEVNAALKNGNAKQLASWFHNSIDLTILQKQGTYSKAQAEQIIQGFFDEHKPTGYKSNHTGSSGDGSKYMIGTLETSGGTFRVYIYYKNIGGKELIQTLRFESNE